MDGATSWPALGEGDDFGHLWIREDRRYPSDFDLAVGAEPISVATRAKTLQGSSRTAIRFELCTRTASSTDRPSSEALEVAA